MTLYEELELTPECSFDDIKHQYRTLARIHHPDLGGDEEKFKRIKFAYEVLSDPERRKQYDDDKTTFSKPSIKTEAINGLANIFFSIIPNFNCQAGNLIESMRNEVTNLKSRAVADEILNETYINNVEIVKSKLTAKDPDKENILMGFIDKQLETRYNDRETFKHRQKLSDEMLSILDNYNYGFLELMNPVEQPITEI
jgi:curved DNA-binding protein CbpA